MKRSLRWTAMAGCLAAGGMTMVATCQENNTPQIPGTPWRVHDDKRPQPAMVENAGAVIVKPPGDAKVLFDGKSLAAWTNDGKDATWPVKDGVFTAAPGTLSTREKFGAVQVHIEWRVPPGRPVKGQGGGNSGIFLMGLYEVQILQSHDNPTYADGTAGALYGQSPPLVNAIRPQGEWQSYDILFTPPKVEDGKVTEPAVATVLVNGIVVQNARKLLGPTQYRKLATYPDKHPETGPIQLQFHGDPIDFRNVWVRPIAAPN